MLWIAFGKWDSSRGSFFVRDRLYWMGYKWTPLVRVRFRYLRTAHGQ